MDRLMRALFAPINVITSIIKINPIHDSQLHANTILSAFFFNHPQLLFLNHPQLPWREIFEKLSREYLVVPTCTLKNEISYAYNSFMIPGK